MFYKCQAQVPFPSWLVQGVLQYYFVLPLMQVKVWKWNLSGVGTCKPFQCERVRYAIVLGPIWIGVQIHCSCWFYFYFLCVARVTSSILRTGQPHQNCRHHKYNTRQLPPQPNPTRAVAANDSTACIVGLDLNVILNFATRESYRARNKNISNYILVRTIYNFFRTLIDVITPKFTWDRLNRRSTLRLHTQSRGERQGQGVGRVQIPL